MKVEITLSPEDAAIILRMYAEGHLDHLLTDMNPPNNPFDDADDADFLLLPQPWTDPDGWIPLEKPEQADAGGPDTISGTGMNTDQMPRPPKDTEENQRPESDTDQPGKADE